MKHFVYISPHLDDAIISCGCQIIDQIKRGNRVTLITVFTKGNEDTLTIDFYQLRKDDDLRAAEFLEVHVFHLDYIDAPFRDKKYHNFSSILFHHRLNDEENKLALQISESLTSLFDQLSPNEIFFPLGLGGHIDHHLVYSAAQYLCKNYNNICYYEELPYAFVNGWIAIRWNHLNALPNINKQVICIKKISFIDIRLAFIHNYCNSDDDKIESSAKYEIEWNQSLHMIDAEAWYKDKDEFMRTSFEVSIESLKKKCQAISYYSTECKSLFGKSFSSIFKTLCPNKKQKKYCEFFWKKVDA